MTKLALVMIVRDEARCLARCLDSVRGVVDEIIVLDTGSTDATVDIARAAGARVAIGAWAQDFAAARNAALAMSEADWNLILDADEWLQGDPASLRALGSPDYIGVLPVASEIDLNQRVELSVSWLPRLLPHGVGYAGRIHEQPISDLPRRRLDLEIRHDGYRQTQLRAKRGRNERMLCEALARDPDNPVLLYQLGCEYQVAEDYPRALELLSQAYARSSPGDNFRHSLVTRLIFVFKKCARYEDGLRFVEREMPNWTHSPDFHFALGDLMLDWAGRQPERAEGELMPVVEASWLKCLEIGDQPLLEGSVRGRGSHLAALNLAIVYAGLGDEARSRHYAEMGRQMQADRERA